MRSLSVIGNLAIDIGTEQEAYGPFCFTYKAVVKVTPRAKAGERLFSDVEDIRLYIQDEQGDNMYPLTTGTVPKALYISMVNLVIEDLVAHKIVKDSGNGRRRPKAKN